MANVTMVVSAAASGASKLTPHFFRNGSANVTAAAAMTPTLTFREGTQFVVFAGAGAAGAAGAAGTAGAGAAMCVLPPYGLRSIHLMDNFVDIPAVIVSE